MTYSPNTILAASPVKSLGSLSVVLTMALLTLSACSNAPRELTTRTVETEVKRPPQTATIPKPQPIETLPVEFEVLVQGDGAAFCLSPKGYENLARNQADILRWVREAMWRLNYYERELGDNAAESQGTDDQ